MVRFTQLAPRGMFHMPTIQYIRTKTLAQQTGTTKRYWEKLRLAGGGPPYVKAGSMVLYDPAKVMAWLEGNERTSTSDTGGKAA